MLADELVALEIVDSICDQTVRRTLKKGSSQNWIPGGLKEGGHAAFMVEVV
jgi:hypothetical protein